MQSVRDNTTPSGINTASCFEDKDHTAEDNTAGENMINQDQLLSNAKLQKEGQRKLATLYLLIGLHVGAVSFSVIVNLCIGMVLPWIPSVLNTMLDFLWAYIFIMGNWSKHPANPNPGSIWTGRMVFSMYGIYFLFGVYAGSFSVLVVSNLHIGLPLRPLIYLFMMTELLVTLFFLAIRFESRRHPIEQELEQDDHSGVV
jgi:hypothetical protein